VMSLTQATGRAAFRAFGRRSIRGDAAEARNVGAMKRATKAATLGLALLAIVGGCSQPAYTVEDALADLLSEGFSRRQADCILQGLDAYLREEFEQKQATEGFEQIPARQIENYVKNKFAGVDDVPADLSDEADRLVQECRTRS